MQPHFNFQESEDSRILEVLIRQKNRQKRVSEEVHVEDCVSLGPKSNNKRKLISRYRYRDIDRPLCISGSNVQTYYRYRYTVSISILYRYIDSTFGQSTDFPVCSLLGGTAVWTPRILHRFKAYLRGGELYALKQ